MKQNLDLPTYFSIPYEKPHWNGYIQFSMYREPGVLSWNGYYQECRVRIWSTGDVWVVAGYVGGIQACYFRTESENADLKVINKLVQCACYYIDQTKKKEENS